MRQFLVPPLQGVLIEILASRSNEEIALIKAAYKKDMDRDLEEDLMSETGGNFKRLLVSLANGCRDESGEVDAELAANNAQALADAGVEKWGTDEEMFNRILCTLNHEQLRLVFDEYEVRDPNPSLTPTPFRTHTQWKLRHHRCAFFAFST